MRWRADSCASSGHAFFAAALWAVHPVLTESVTNMIGRSDLLSAMAVLSGFLMYLQSTESAGWRRLAWLAGLMAVTAVGVFSKESAVVIVGVIALYELTWWKERKQGRALLLGCIATLLPIAAMLYQRSIVLAASQPAEFPFTDNPIVGAGFWTGRLTAIEVIARYLGLTLWPAKLSSDYSYAQIPLAHGALGDWAACIAVLAAALLVVALYWWNRTAFFLASFAAITFVPMSNLLFPIGTIMAERFLYMPAIGLLACLVMAIYAAGQTGPDQTFCAGRVVRDHRRLRRPDLGAERRLAGRACHGGSQCPNQPQQLQGPQAARFHALCQRRGGCESRSRHRGSREGSGDPRLAARLAQYSGRLPHRGRLLFSQRRLFARA